MSVARFEPRFVEEVPEPLEPGILFVSLEHGSMLHLCACGCGSEVSLPLTPIDWHFTYDGEAISVWPSVGSWSLPCRSHYVIERGSVRWAAGWSDEEVAAGRRRDRRRREAREEVMRQAAPEIAPPTSPGPAVPARRELGTLAAAWRWLSALRERG